MTNDQRGKPIDPRLRKLLPKINPATYKIPQHLLDACAKEHPANGGEPLRPGTGKPA